MSVTQYIGARYVPLFADPIDWDNTRQYEPLTIVYYQGNSYTSKQAVPTGVDISNTDYWAITGNYNAQIEQYRRVSQVVADSLPSSDFDEQNTVKNYIDTADNELKDYVDTADNNLENKITAIENKGGPSTLAACNYLGTIPYVTRVDVQKREAVSAICSNGQYEVVITALNPQLETDISTVRFVSVKDDNANVLSPKQVKLGHANSITYVAATNEYYIAPVRVMRNGSLTDIKELWVYNSTFTSMRVIEAPNVPTGVSCDPITGKIYVNCYGDNYSNLFYELNDTEFTLIGTNNLRSPENGDYVQDFGCYNNMWYVNNTTGSFAYGSIYPFKLIGVFDIAKYCTLSDYLLFGEVEGFDFTPDGHLLCTGFYLLSENSISHGYVGTIFEVIYPNSKVPPIAGQTRYFFEPINTTWDIDGNFNRLKQWGPFASPQLAVPMRNRIGSVFTAQLTTDIDSCWIATDSFARYQINLNSHTLTAERIRCESPLVIAGSGTLAVDVLRAGGLGFGTVNFTNGVTLNPSDPNAFFSGFTSTSDIRCGSIQNPNNIKFPSSAMPNMPLESHVTYISSNKIFTNGGEV